MAQTDFTAKQMGKQAVIFGAAALIATFLLSCLVGLLTAGGMLPESAMQVVSMGILCVCVFARQLFGRQSGAGEKADCICFVCSSLLVGTGGICRCSL